MHTERVLDFPAMKSKDYKALAGARIKAAREALRDDRGNGYSQAGFAKLIPGLKAARLGNYESGTRYPGPEVFEAIASVTGEPAAYLAGLIDGELADLLRALHRMDIEDRRDVAHFAGRRKSLSAKQVEEFGVEAAQAIPARKKPSSPRR